jgi:hypothetical protein
MARGSGEWATTRRARNTGRTEVVQVLVRPDLGIEGFWLAGENGKTCSDCNTNPEGAGSATTRGCGEPAMILLVWTGGEAGSGYDPGENGEQRLQP